MSPKRGNSENPRQPETAVLWAVCGAGKGVGKTTLARALCDILPRSVYAKKGRGTPKPSKSPNFFTGVRELRSFIRKHRKTHRHMVIESHHVADEADVVIFIDAPARFFAPRNDASELRDKAHVIIDGKNRKKEYETALRRVIRSPSLRGEVEALLERHRRRMLASQVQVRSKTWFVSEEEHVFGPGLARLLEGIRRFQSLSKAAEAAGVSYKYAWGQLRAARERLGAPLISSRAGGTDGGSTVLTPEGVAFLDIFRRLNKDVAAYADRRFQTLISRQLAGTGDGR